MPKAARIDERALRAALARSQGNIAKACADLGCSRVHGMRQIKAFSLSELARNLRLLSGQPGVGRPKKKTVSNA